MHIIIVGPEFKFTTEDEEAFVEAVEATLGPGPSFNALGMPVEYNLPVFTERGYVLTPQQRRISKTDSATLGDSASVSV